MTWADWREHVQPTAERIASEGTGRRMPICQATVTEVNGRIVRFRYADDAPIFGGLTGTIRLPGWTTK